MEANSLLQEIRKIFKKCSRLTEQLRSHPSPQLLTTLHSALSRGEILEHRLFQLAGKENLSLNQLKLLGHKVTFAQWRRANPLPHDLNSPLNIGVDGPISDNIPAPTVIPTETTALLTSSRESCFTSGGIRNVDQDRESWAATSGRKRSGDSTESVYLMSRKKPHIC